MGIPATVFILPDLIEENGWMWPDKFNYIEEKLRGSSNELNLKVSKQILANLKKLPVNKRDEQIRDIAQNYNIKIPLNPPLKYKLMSWDQLKDVIKTELIEIGSHTCTHPIMSHLNNEDSWYEINKSKKMISEKLNIEVSSFCYPNGKPDDYREEHKIMLEQAGYLCGIAAHFGYIEKNSDIYALPRISDGGRDLNLFLNYLDGCDYFLTKIFKKKL